jgi:site-specific recombinase XerD
LQSACQTDYERSVINIFLKTGVRVSEAASIKLNDVNSKGEIRVMGKGAKERLVVIPLDLLEIIDSYVESRVEKSDLLFPHGARSLETIIRRVTDRTSIKKHISAHKLRHTFASMYYEDKKDLAKLRDLLGHTNTSTTSIYVHTSEEDRMKDLPDFMRRI